MQGWWEGTPACRRNSPRCALLTHPPAAELVMAVPPAAADWDAWVEGAVADLHARHLFRALRPWQPGGSAVEVRPGAAQRSACC